MTEPIIINGVDVSKCIHYKNQTCIAKAIEYCKIKDKQLKRKEQELSEIKNDIETRTFCVTCKKENENDKLKVECEKYKNCINDVKELAKIALEDDDKPACVYDDDCPLNNGVGFDNHCDLTCPYIISKKIVDKINEVENEY